MKPERVSPAEELARRDAEIRRNRIEQLAERVFVSIVPNPERAGPPSAFVTDAFRLAEAFVAECDRRRKAP